MTITLNGSSGITTSTTGNSSIILDAGTGSASANQESYIDFKLDGTLKSTIKVTEATSGNPLEFHTGGAQRVVIDSSGNLLVGTTDSNPASSNDAGGVAIRETGQVNVSRDNNPPLQLNRKTSEGDLAVFQKDGTTIGTIGTYLSASYFLGSGSTGIFLNGKLNPSGSGGAINDDNMDIGQSNRRWKDLYLSGTIQIQSGTGNVGVGVDALNSNSGDYNTAVGYLAGYSTTTATRNTAIGYRALYNNTTGINTSVGVDTLYTNTTGTDNVAIGGSNGATVGAALGGNSTGNYNVAIGTGALRNNTTASNNTAVGYQALYTNTTGAAITAVGQAALKDNTTGNYNVALGSSALENNTTANDNVGIGFAALAINTTGSQNVAVGRQALYNNTTASFNTSVGFQAGYSNTTGAGSVYMGYQAGDLVTTGNGNVVVGSQAGTNNNFGECTFLGGVSGFSNAGNKNTFIGQQAGYYVSTGTSNTILGRFNGNSGGLDIRTSSNNIVLADGDGNPKAWWDSAYNCKLRMGSGGGTNTMKYNTSTYEVTFDTSSARYKENIRDSIYGLNAVLSLSAKQFEYKKDGRSDIGLIAEEVVSVIPELVGTDADGRPDSVTYDRMVSVLVKAIQELSAKNDALEARLAALENA